MATQYQRVYDEKRFYGVPNKLYFCNLELDAQINDNIYKRNIPDAPLQPSYIPVPVSTKYALMPILDQRMTPTVPLKNYPIYNSSQNFNPGNAEGPYTGFAQNVNLESSLRNQFFALQSCPQAYYVPSSKSDLYNVVVPPKPVKQQFPYLFEQEVFNHMNPNTNNLGNNIFNNCTRVEMKNIIPESEKQLCKQ